MVLNLCVDFLPSFRRKKNLYSANVHFLPLLFISEPGNDLNYYIKLEAWDYNAEWCKLISLSNFCFKKGSADPSMSKHLLLNLVKVPPCVWLYLIKHVGVGGKGIIPWKLLAALLHQ